MAATKAMGIVLLDHHQQQPQQPSPRPQPQQQKQAIQGQASGSIRPLTHGPVGAQARLAGRTPSGTALYQIPRNVLDLSQPLDTEAQQGVKQGASAPPTKKRPSPAAPAPAPSAKPSPAAAAAAAARAGWSPAASPQQAPRSSKQEPRQLTRQPSTGMDEAMAAHALLNISQQARRSDDSAAAGSSKQWRGLRDAAPSSSRDLSPAAPRSRQQEEAGYGPNKASRLHMMGAPGSSSRSQRQQQGRPQQQQQQQEEEAAPRQQHKWDKQQQWLLKAGLLVEGAQGQPDQGSQVLWRKWVAVMEAHSAGFTQEAMHMAMQLGAHTATFLQARGEDAQDIQNMGIGLTALCVSPGDVLGDAGAAGGADAGWWAAAPAAAAAAPATHPQPHQQPQQHLQHDRLAQLRTAGGEAGGAAQPGTPQKTVSGSSQPTALARALAARNAVEASSIH